MLNIREAGDWCECRGLFGRQGDGEVADISRVIECFTLSLCAWLCPAPMLPPPSRHVARVPKDPKHPRTHANTQLPKWCRASTQLPNYRAHLTLMLNTNSSRS